MGWDWGWLALFWWVFLAGACIGFALGVLVHGVEW